MTSPYSQQTEQRLQRAGWSRDRRVPVADVIHEIQAAGFVIHPWVPRFLESYTGVDLVPGQRCQIAPGFWIGTDEEDSDHVRIGRLFTNVTGLTRRVVSQLECVVGPVTPIAYQPSASECWYARENGQIVSWSCSNPGQAPIILLGSREEALELYLLFPHRLMLLGWASPQTAQLLLNNELASPQTLAVTGKAILESGSIPVRIELAAFALPGLAESFSAEEVGKHPMDQLTRLRRIADTQPAYFKQSVLFAVQGWTGTKPRSQGILAKLFRQNVPTQLYSWDSVSQIQIEGGLVIIEGTASRILG